MRRAVQLIFFASIDLLLSNSFNQEAHDYLPQHIIPSAARVSVSDDELKMLLTRPFPPGKIDDRSEFFQSEKTLKYQWVEYATILISTVDS